MCLASSEACAAERGNEELVSWRNPTVGGEGEGPAEETPFPAHRRRNGVLILGPGEAGADEEFLAADG